MFDFDDTLAWVLNKYQVKNPTAWLEQERVSENTGNNDGEANWIEVVWADDVCEVFHGNESQLLAECGIYLDADKAHSLFADDPVISFLVGALDRNKVKIYQGVNDIIFVGEGGAPIIRIDTDELEYKIEAAKIHDVLCALLESWDQGGERGVIARQRLCDGVATVLPKETVTH